VHDVNNYRTRRSESVITALCSYCRTYNGGNMKDAFRLRAALRALYAGACLPSEGKAQAALASHESATTSDAS